METPTANLPWAPRKSRHLSFCLLLLLLANALISLSALRAGTVLVSNYCSPNTGLDVTQGIKNALAAANPGDTVQFSAGTYLVSSALTPTATTTLTGMGESKTIIGDIGTTSHNMIGIMTTSGVTIEQMTLDGQGDTYVSDGIHVNTGSCTNINNVQIKNIPKANAIDFIAKVTNSFIQNNTISNIGSAGIWLETNSSYNTITGNSISNAAAGGVRVHMNSTNVVIEDNTISGSTNGLGIETWVGCSHADIEGNTVDRWLSICESDQVAVRRNTVHDTTDTFTGIGLEEVDSQDSVYTENVVTGQSLSMSTDTSSIEPNEYHFLANNTFDGSGAPVKLLHAALLQGKPGAAQNPKLYTGQSYFYDDSFANCDTGFEINTWVNCINFEACQFMNNVETGSYSGIRNINGGGSVSNDDVLSFVGCQIENNGHAFKTDLAVPNLLWSTTNTVSGNFDNTTPPTSESPTGFWEGGPTASFTVTDTGTNGIANTACTAMPGDTITFNPAGSTVTGTAVFGHLLWDLDAGPAFSSADNTTSQSYKYKATIPTGTQGVADQPGNYMVSLIVWDSLGRASRAEESVAYDDFAEAETCTVTCSPAGTSATNFSDSPAYILSGNAASKFNATGTAQSVSYNYPSVSTGTYEILARVKEINSRGMFQLSIGPSGGTLVNLGPVEDTYNPGTAYVTLDLGSYVVSNTGTATVDQTLKFTVMDKNDNSSGYSLAFDYFEFAPIQ